MDGVANPDADWVVRVAGLEVEALVVPGRRGHEGEARLGGIDGRGADVILEIDWQGALQIKRIFTNAVLIFILLWWLLGYCNAMQ